MRYLKTEKEKEKENRNKRYLTNKIDTK